MGHGIGSCERACARAAFTQRLRVKVGLWVVFPNGFATERLRDPLVTCGAFEVVLHCSQNVPGPLGAVESAALLANDDGDVAKRVAVRPDRFADDVHVLHYNEGVRGVDIGVVGLDEDAAL